MSTPKQTLRLSHLLSASEQEKVAALPLEFQYLPVEILSKQFTKLNSPHPYRIHYLGARPINSQILHKKYAGSSQQQQKDKRYQFNQKKIVQSNFMNEKMQSNHFYKSAIYYRAFEGMNPTLNLQQQYIFNSVFECGNLDCVIKASQVEFDLFLRIDSNTRGHTQWFYFSIKNGPKKEKITINICNLTKPNSLYQQGMKPYIYSTNSHELTATKWQQTNDNCTNCRFEQKQLRYDLVYERANIPHIYRLSFDYQFTTQNDQVFFAYSIPYSYSQLRQDITALSNNNKHIHTSICGYSLTGMQIPLLHISNHHQSQQSQQLQQSQGHEGKKNILITGRVHPGESNGSHVLNGFIQFLCSQHKEAIDLRSKVNLFIIPMINPDGVVMGNTRTSAAGKDLNREYLSTKRDLYPEIFVVKTLAMRLQRQYGVMMYLDFHGHSRKKNTFFYGPPYMVNEPKYYKCRIYPRLVSKINNAFRFHSCSFMVSEEKKRTARAFLFYQIKIPYTYTVESSVGLYYDSQLMKTFEFDAESWENIGRDICQGLSQFILAHQEYQELLKQRKLDRQRVKERKEKFIQRKSRKFVEDELEEEPVQVEKQKQKQKKANSFIEMIDSVKTTIASQSKNLQDQDASSDDHDDAEDLETSKLAEFNNLIMQNAQKDRIKLGRSRKQTPILQQQYTLPDNIDPQDEEEFREETTDDRKAKRTLPQKEESKKVFNVAPLKKVSLPSADRPTRTSQEKIKRKTVLEQKKPSTAYQSFREKQSQKDFVTANKQRYSVIAKNFLPSDDRCEILELPKTFQNLRKEIKKGRVFTNNSSDVTARVLQSQRHQPDNLKGQLSMKCYKFKNLRQTQPKTTFSRMQTGGIITNQSRRGGFSREAIRKNLSAPRTVYNSSEDYNPLEGIVLDNMAMTIRSFRGMG